MDMLDHALESQDRDTDSNDTKELISAQTLTIVEDDGSLGSGGEDSGAVVDLEHQGLLEGDEDLQYQFRPPDGSTVTYRVVVPSSNGNDSMEQMPQIVSATGNFHTGGSVQQGVHTVLGSSLNGQFYVIGSTQEVLCTQGARSLAPRSTLQLDTGRGSGSMLQRDDRRRATHNEVERRRRDKINNWIGKLSKIIPDCNSENSKTVQSKGGILAKACEYIVELRTTNQRLGECLKEQENLTLDMERLRRQNEELKG